MAAPDREDSPELPEKGRPALFFAAADPGPPELFPAFAAGAGPQADQHC